MARIRQIKPEFFLDDELAYNCCRDARLLFIGLWTIADCEGRLEDRPVKIKAQVFPYDDIDPVYISALLDELERGQFVVRYAALDKKVILIRNFLKHQHVHPREQASLLPSPSIEVIKKPGNLLSCPEINAASTSGVLSIDNGLVASQPPSAKKRRPTQRTGTPDQFDISDSLKEWASKVCPNLNLEVETEKFLDHHRAAGNSFKDWDAAWRKWMRNAAEWGSARNHKSSSNQGRFDAYGYLDEMIASSEGEKHGN